MATDDLGDFAKLVPIVLTDRRVVLRRQSEPTGTLERLQSSLEGSTDAAEFVVRLRSRSVQASRESLDTRALQITDGVVRQQRRGFLNNDERRSI